MKKSRISAIFFTGSIICLFISNFFDPRLGREYTFVTLSILFIILLIISMIMALKETEHYTLQTTQLGNARCFGTLPFFFLVLTSVILVFNGEGLSSDGVFILLWIISSTLCLMGVVTYKKSDDSIEVQRSKVLLRNVICVLGKLENKLDNAVSFNDILTYLRKDLSNQISREELNKLLKKMENLRLLKRENHHYLLTELGKVEYQALKRLNLESINADV